ncbi:hypothetical protein AWB76_02487 [Caballeronia temeraria]|uniref:DUF4942 domain-containing protein n=2 Tax=Caballeronia TaxID=1827195 RepID=A0A158DKM3_9BURK|nr:MULTISPECIES: hypothetical protein [Caballeronia]SAK57643.1 hypothetical protein AWB76_02487 [Caballeronia temeraria]SAK94960.1 hypothetical protein AWB75_06870 [Caballeronia catudaia]
MYTQLIEQFKNAQTAAASAYSVVVQAERDAFGDGKSDYSAMETRSEYKAECELEKFCARLVSRLVMEASRKFAPAGGRIEIDSDREAERFGLDVGEALRKGHLPNLDGFWQHLERTFGGDAGERIAFEQAAKAIISGFWLKPDTEIKRTSSAVILEKRVSSEASFRSKGEREVNYHSQSSVASTLGGLATFADKHRFGALANQLRNFSVHRLTFSTREKLTFTGLEVVMFNDKWQFKFAHDVGDALSIFVSEFGAEYLASRDRY